MSDSEPEIISADFVDNAVIITFDNGKTGLFKAELLHSILSQAIDVPEPENEDDEAPLIGEDSSA